MTRPTREIEHERLRKMRLVAARAQRERNVLAALDDETLTTMGQYQQDKARAARQGKPVLKTYDEWRGAAS